MRDNKVIPFEDFTDRLYSVQQKYFVVSMISIFISIFDLIDESKFFGVEVVNLNERLMEFGFYIVALFLGLLYSMRLLEERSVVSKIQSQTSLIITQLNSHAVDISNINSEIAVDLQGRGMLSEMATIQLNNFSASIIRVMQTQREMLARINDKQRLSEIEIGIRMQLNAELEAFIGTVKDLIEKLNRNSDQLSDAIEHWDEMAGSLMNVTANPVHRTVLSAQRKFRVVLFEYILPLVLFIVITLAFLFPDNSDNIANFLRFAEN